MYTEPRYITKEARMKKSLFLICKTCDHEFTKVIVVDPELELEDSINGIFCPECESYDLEIDGEDITGIYDQGR